MRAACMHARTHATLWQTYGVSDKTRVISKALLTGGGGLLGRTHGWDSTWMGQHRQDSGSGTLTQADAHNLLTTATCGNAVTVPSHYHAGSCEPVTALKQHSLAPLTAACRQRPSSQQLSSLGTTPHHDVCMVASWPGGLRKHTAAQAGPGQHIAAAPSRTLHSYRQAHMPAPSALDCHHAQLCNALLAGLRTRPAHLIFLCQHYRHSCNAPPRQHGSPEGSSGSRAACSPAL
jgi:hypothetical protein